jgi:hypothetical protein
MFGTGIAKGSPSLAKDECMQDGLTSSIKTDWTTWFDRQLAIPHIRSQSFGKTRRIAWALLLSVIVIYAAATVARVYARKYYLFLPDYVRWTLSAAPDMPAGPIHVFFLLVDHFEPNYSAARTQQWGKRYRALAARHHDSLGRPPQHTWFYPGEQSDDLVLEQLRLLTAAGLGEVELHYHHGYDTAVSVRAGLAAAIERFQRFGFLRTVDGQTHFAFIHGNGSLDNSNGQFMCGVDRELQVLHDLGCFADFTFPSIFSDAQPPVVNEIYAVRDDDGPKSYRTPLPLTTIDDGTADLMIFQGPLIFAPTLSLRRLFLELDDGNVHATVPASPGRVDRWIRARIHVAQRPDWVFVKVWAHGISSEDEADAVLDSRFDETLTYLERRYNDGEQYVLHYVTAREAYNLVRAAVRGATADPQQYYDAVIPPYISSPSCTRSPHGVAQEEPPH